MMFGLLHHHPLHSARQHKWVLPTLVLLALAVGITFAVFYQFSNQDIGSEFFSAHKSISNTRDLLNRGIVYAGIALGVVVLALAFAGLRLSHRIVRPVHTIHRALDELATGNLGVRIELHRNDEFHEVSQSINRLVQEFSETLGKVHAVVDEIEELAGRVAAGPQDDALEARLHGLARELNQTMEFFQLQPEEVIREDAA